jgi:hypothetical protein
MIHRTGKRALHKSKTYSVNIEAVEIEERDEKTEASTDSDDHATVSRLFYVRFVLA